MKLSPRQIIETVAVLHHVDPDELTGPSRARRLWEPRHEAMLALRQHTDLSLSEIGDRFGGRDHTTVLNGIRRAAQRKGIPVPRCDRQPRPPRPPCCEVDGCDGDVHARGLCGPHYWRLLRHGSVFADVPVGDMRRHVPERVFAACEGCGGSPLGGSRWCAVGGCGQEVRRGRWSWSQQRSVA